MPFMTNEEYMILKYLAAKNGYDWWFRCERQLQHYSSSSKYYEYSCLICNAIVYDIWEHGKEHIVKSNLGAFA